MEKKKNSAEYIPEFENGFLRPGYWGAWLGIAAFAGIAMIPPSLRDPILGKLGRFVGRKALSARRISVETTHAVRAIANDRVGRFPVLVGAEDVPPVQRVGRADGYDGHTITLAPGTDPHSETSRAPPEHQQDRSPRR